MIVARAFVPGKDELAAAAVEGRAPLVPVLVSAIVWTGCGFEPRRKRVFVPAGPKLARLLARQEVAA